jgi:aminoglycoside phosphotransferase (APT) family kinase protein
VNATAVTGLPGAELDMLAAWLAKRGTGVVPPLRAERIGLGQSNLTYLLRDAAGRRWVLRRPPAGQLLESAHDMAREHRILAALPGTRVPAPGVVGLLRNGRADQLVMEFVDGVVVDRLAAARCLSAAARAGVGPSLARTLAAIHAVDLDRAALSDLASHSPYAQRQLRRWTRQLEASRTRELPRLDRLTQLLARWAPTQDELVLVHGDLHLSNVICAPDTGAVLAALDWELSTLGAPLADLGTMLAYWPETGEQAAGMFTASAMPGFARRDELVEAYVGATGRDVSDLGFWHVLGLWKIAIIGEGVRRRVFDEPGNAAPGGPPSTAVIDEVVERAWTLVPYYRR